LEQQTFTFAGRQYRTIVRRTIENDFTCMSLIRGARLDTLVMEDGEAPEDFAVRMYERAVGSADVFRLLGCMLVPAEVDDLDWTKPHMEATAAALRRVVEPAEKRQIQTTVVGMISGFFHNGLTSLRLSRKSSSPPEAEAQPSSETEGNSISGTGS
jgi:hypothetical protein